MILETLRRHAEKKRDAEAGIKETCTKFLINLCSNNKARLVCKNGIWAFENAKGSFVTELSLSMYTYTDPEAMRLRDCVASFVGIVRDIKQEYNVDVWEFLEPVTPKDWDRWVKESERYLCSYTCECGYSWKETQKNVSISRCPECKTPTETHEWVDRYTDIEHTLGENY